MPGKSPHTAKYRPWRIETAVTSRSRDKAVTFERYLKSHSGRAFAARHFCFLDLRACHDPTPYGSCVSQVDPPVLQIFPHRFPSLIRQLHFSFSNNSFISTHAFSRLLVYDLAYRRDKASVGLGMIFPLAYKVLSYRQRNLNLPEIDRLFSCADHSKCHILFNGSKFQSLALRIQVPKVKQMIQWPEIIRNRSGKSDGS